MPKYSNHYLPLVLFGIFAFVEVWRNFSRATSVVFYEKDYDSVATVNVSASASGRSSVALPPKTTVAYAVSVTAYKPKKKDPSASNEIDRAAVLHQSIKLAMKKSLKYNYHIYAFVHPDAIDAKPLLEKLGYRVQVKETPFNVKEISNEELIEAQGNGCCKEKEYLKLYSYLLLDYPVVVHLDLDTIVLKPMDEVFDLMTMTNTDGKELDSFARESSMWLTKSHNASLTHASKTILSNPKQINFMFTRDYNMVDPEIPIYKKPYQIGVQGGFLVIRPNQRDFDRMVQIILSGGYGFNGDGWGGSKLAYGGYYGAGTIQGLASFYYDYVENATRSVELNRCYYNNMVDEPSSFDKRSNKTLCRTTEEHCQDCRQTEIESIYTAHFTVCGKPEWCMTINPKNKNDRLCSFLLREWHKTRLSLEVEWMNRFSTHNSSALDFPYVPVLAGLDPTKSSKHRIDSNKMGHCEGGTYIPMLYPSTEETPLIR